MGGNSSTFQRSPSKNNGDPVKKFVYYLGMIAATTCAVGLAAESVENAAQGIASTWLLTDMTGAAGGASIAGVKDLWTDVVLQKGIGGPGMATLAADLNALEVKGQLRHAGFRVMDPEKRSLAFGMRPTLEIAVFYAPQSAPDSRPAFYEVVATARQECKPLGGSKISLVTWAKIGDPIQASGDDGKNADAIRASVRDGVKAFIDAARL